MIAYQFNTAGFYQCETEADESPLEPGVFLLPARCTLVPPPEEIPDGKWPRWSGTAWTLATKPAAPIIDSDPVAKLAAFLNNNPDVAALLSNDGGANV